ncbi:MAG: tyrosine-type recombinase/integrase [Egibacteraceae bacterium]
MASSSKQPNGRWKVRYWTPDGRAQRSKTFDRKVDAERFAASTETDKAYGTRIDPRCSKETIGSWCQRWRETKVNFRRSTLSRLDTKLRVHVLPEFGHRTLAHVSNADVRAWVARLVEEGRPPTTVRKAYFALHDMPQAAMADRRLAFNPAQDVPLPAEHAEEERFLSPAEVARLADAIHPRFRALVLVAVYGGLRFGELAALRRSHVDLLRGRVTVAETLVDVDGVLSFGPPKTKNSRRTVPLPRRVVAELGKHMSTYVRPEADAVVFTGSTGALLRRSRFRQSWWLPVVTAAGLNGLRCAPATHRWRSPSIDTATSTRTRRTR